MKKPATVVKLADYQNKQSTLERFWAWIKPHLVFDLKRHHEPRGCRFTHGDLVKRRFVPIVTSGTVTKVVTVATVYVKWTSGLITLEHVDNLVKVS